MADEIGGHVSRCNFPGSDSVEERPGVSRARGQCIDRIALLGSIQTWINVEHDRRCLRVVVRRQPAQRRPAQCRVGNQLLKDRGKLVVASIEQRGQGGLSPQGVGMGIGHHPAQLGTGLRIAEYHGQGQGLIANLRVAARVQPGIQFFPSCRHLHLAAAFQSLQKGIQKRSLQGSIFVLRHGADDQVQGGRLRR